MFGLSLLTPRVILELVVAAFIVGACWYVGHVIYSRGAHDVQVLWDADKQAQEKQTNQLKDEARAKTDSLQAQVDKQRSLSNAQIAKLSSDLSTAIDGLRDRAPRPSALDMPNDTGAGPTGCTGAQLYRPDAEFLARGAAERDTLAVLLGQCQAAYSAARAALTQ